MADRVVFLVDGFNVYHSIKDLHQATGVNCRWLDLRSLCDSIVRTSFGPGVALEDVHYFSALATHRDPQGHGAVARHKAFISALESTGVEVHLGRFKRKDVSCRNYRYTKQVGVPSSCVVNAKGKLCHGQFVAHEEKETDVAIACMLMELVLADACEHVVLVSGDTDLLPAISSARRLRPQKSVVIAQPYGRHRHSAELKNAATRQVSITEHLYQTHQLPNPVPPTDGRSSVAKPSTW